MLRDLVKLRFAGKRARLALKFFGEDVGKQLLPLVAQGAAGVRAAVEDARSAGLVLDRDQQARVDAAAASVKRGEATIEGGWNKLTAAVAPLTSVLYDAITAMRPVIDWATRAITPVATFAAGVIRAAGQAVKAVAQWVASSLGIGSNWPAIEDVITGVLRRITFGIALLADSSRKLAGELAQLGAKLLLAFGAALTPAILLANQLKRLPSSLRPPGTDTLADGLSDAQLRAAGAAAELDQWGKSQVGAFGEWSVQAGLWFDKLMEKKKGLEGIKSQVTPKETLWKGNAALAAGSQEAVSAEIRAVMNTTGDKHLAELRRGNALAAQGNAALGVIASRLPRLGVI